MDQTKGQLYRLELDWTEIFALDDLLDLTEELEPDVFHGFDMEAIERIQKQVHQKMAKITRDDDLRFKDMP